MTWTASCPFTWRGVSDAKPPQLTPICEEASSYIDQGQIGCPRFDDRFEGKSELSSAELLLVWEFLPASSFLLSRFPLPRYRGIGIGSRLVVAPPVRRLVERTNSRARAVRFPSGHDRVATLQHGRSTTPDRERLFAWVSPRVAIDIGGFLNRIAQSAVRIGAWTCKGSILPAAGGNTSTEERVWKFLHCPTIPLARHDLAGLSTESAIRGA